MSDVEIVNPVPVDEVRPWGATLATTFLDEAQGDTFERYLEAWQREWYADRVWGARANGRWVATLATEARTITIPGPSGSTRDVEADALTAVTVNATHRRRGLLTSMLTQSLRAARERNDPFGMLIAAEWPIYGRFGYSPASLAAKYTYFPRRSAVVASGAGSVRQVEPADLADIAPAVFARARARQVGQVDRPAQWWPRRLCLDGYRPIVHGKSPTVYLHESADGPDGLLWWAPEREFELNGDLGAVNVTDLVAANDTAYRNLWAYLGGIDVVSEITLNRRPVDEAVRWLLADGRALRQTYVGDDVWIRLLDVPAALTARGYSSAGELVLDVVDDDTGGYAAGRFLLVSNGDSGECAATTDEPDIRLSQRALASLYLGGFSLEQLRLAGWVDELTSGSVQRMDAMFATTTPPWNATGF